MRNIYILVLTVLFAASCSQGSTGLFSSQQEQQDPIVGGSLESGWRGVGALTFQIPGYGYQGSFCTGTLIAPRWVLTAAHCLDEHDGNVLEPNFVMFYVGSDARPSGYGLPPGDFFQADAFIIHEDYNPQSTDHDIGLLHLAESASGVPQYDYNTSAMGGSYIGESAFYVGFGVTDGINETGSGQKRSGSIEIANVYADTYLSQYGTTGVCFGDSGGPGLFQYGSSDWRIIGVNSTVAGSGSGDPCRAYYNQTRVDAYAGWIAGIIGAPPPSCQNNPDMCYCSAACQSNGTCNNTVCQTLDCEGIYDCLGDCDEQDRGCPNDCYLTGTEEGKGLLDDMFSCFSQHCEGLEGDAYQTCVSNNCNGQVEACMPVATGSEDCEFIYGCIADCPQDQQGCSIACYEQGTAQAQQNLDAMFTCFNDQCGSLSGSEWQTCVGQNCSTQVTTCMPPANCVITGGECSADLACYPATGDTTDCFSSDNLQLGQICNPNAQNLPCGDGLICLAGSLGGRCFQFCLNQGDCPGDEICEIPIFTNLDDIGVCVLPPPDAGGGGPDARVVGTDATPGPDGYIPGTDAAVVPRDAAAAGDAGSTHPDRVNSDLFSSGSDDSAVINPEGRSYLESCEEDSDCKNNICRPVADRGQVCLVPCDARLGHYQCPEFEGSGCVPNDVYALNLGGLCYPAIASRGNQKIGAPCGQENGFETCESGLCETVCLMPCVDGRCPQDYSCDTSEVASPGICRPDPPTDCGGCANTGDGQTWSLGLFAAAALLLRRRR